MYLLISTELNERFSVGLGNSGLKKVKIVEKPYRQAELLLKTIDSLVKKEKISGVIVVQGAGQFSALRIGVVTANALAYSLNVPVVGVKLKKAWEKLEEKLKLEKVFNAGLKEMNTAELNSWVMPYYDKEPNIT